MPSVADYRVLAATVCLLAVAPAAWTWPDELPNVTRAQRNDVTLDPEKRLAIWLIGIGQGDSILVQLPPALSRRLDNPAGDPVDILIDGGGRPQSDADRARKFLHGLYANRSQVTVEYMVLTHHDQDHIVGLTKVLEDTGISVDHVYYNGLSAFRKGVTGLTPREPGAAFVLSGERVLGKFTPAKILEEKYVLPSLVKLDTAHGPPAQLINDFEDFAGAAANKPVKSFRRAQFGDSDAASLDLRVSRAAAAGQPAFKIQTLWPQSELLRYGDWGKTTNGNSVVFRLDYGDFSMLFTGDLNEQSGSGFVTHLEEQRLQDRLDVDVLKAPHHGSEHLAREFSEHPRLKPIVTVASMGSSGFKLTGHRHPRDSTIRQFGGAERFYSTYIEEEDFKWKDLKKPRDLEPLIEDTHVLIETDGRHFRVVEVERKTASDQTPKPIPPLRSVAPGDGTLWIDAR